MLPKSFEKLSISICKSIFQLIFCACDGKGIDLISYTKKHYRNIVERDKKNQTKVLCCALKKYQID